MREERCQGFALKKGDGSFICQLLSKNSTIAVDLDKTSRVSLSETIAPKEFEFAMVTGKIHFLRAMGKGQFPKARSTCKGEGLAHLVMDDRGQEWHDYVLEFMESHFPSQDKFWIGADDTDWNSEHSWDDETLVADSMKTFWLPGEPNFKKGKQDERCVAMVKSPESPGGMWEDVSCFETLPITCESGWNIHHNGEAQANAMCYCSDSFSRSKRSGGWGHRNSAHDSCAGMEHETDMDVEQRCLGFPLKKGDDSFICQLLSKNSTFAVDPNKTSRISVSDTLVADSMKTFWLPGEPNFKDGSQQARCVAMGKSPESPGGMWEDVACTKTLPITCEIRLP
ncbi:unnamed protein product [Darwinula stevensoni]|uniref:C-type lectin domain-containing protein n=1 Tax=Darwinula stevensoni TaxID=69355 RepID=A0A7R8XC78_9CRUS|nr:unnamed protein product [Darwinula stevensoni]CAG0892279.1 unnamed protein product [Darwinula stevensoni]